MTKDRLIELTAEQQVFVKEIQALLLKTHSRAQRDLLVKQIGSNGDKLRAAIYILCHHSYREVQRVSWVVQGIAEKHPELITDYLPVLLQRLSYPPIPDAVKRNTIKILSQLPVPEILHGEVVSVAFKYLYSKDESIAIRAFSISVLEKLSRLYPDIGSELRSVLEIELDKQPAPAIKSRAQKALSTLRKQHKA